MVEIPEDRVGVVGLGRIEPEVDTLLTVTFPAGKDVSLENIRLTGPVSQELEVYLVVFGVLGRKLHAWTYEVYVYGKSVELGI